MKKLIILAAVILLPSGVFAQGKIAFVNTQEVLTAMPELSDMEKKMADLNESYKKELELMQGEYDKKYQMYMSQQDSLTENIKLRRMQELQDIQGRMENVYQMAQSDVPKKQEELYQPIQQKMMEAIKSIGTENGFLYILNPAAILFTGTDAVDATPQVKAKLGLK
ncbi:periplasmic chaperone [Bacteroidales bacterium Barb6]|nr:periplasmic chaperone [Bacteroidales bacterium Barb6]OAV67709.1 periplasmic chaperone [Bacteroidales bacterium Barb6XT]OAV70623.1 periplasmic chaperone [Bacteroidales bacterium Barb4]